MSDFSKYSEDLVMVILRNEIDSRNPSEEDIRNAINQASKLVTITEADRMVLERSIQAKMSVRMDLGTSLVDPVTYHPWLMSRIASINPYYWSRYKDYLLRDKGWNANVVEKLGDVSDEILNLIGDPVEKGIWKRKGLILGDIQSGKTSNYIALCNKAADAGYKVVILLTGTIEGLRKQTQERIDAGFVGLNSRNVLKRNPEKKYTGVGLQDNKRTAYPFTDVLQDFDSHKLQSLNFTLKGLSEPIVLAVKKNKSVLNNLETWLRTCNTDVGDDKIDLPLLLIDDEADNASVNTNKEDEKPTAINECIKSILKLFNRSSYVAVTATPFANIFIDPEEDIDTYNLGLFPSDFIYALSPPTNYIGSNQIFGDEPEYSSSLVVIDDINEHFRSTAKSSHIVPELPNSLMEALAYFLIVNTVRDLDGSLTSHRSMLINVSQFVNIQDQVFSKVESYLKGAKQEIQNNCKLDTQQALRHPNLQFIKSVWDRFLFDSITGYGWEEIQHSLYEAIMPMQIRLVNQKAKDKGIERLDYEPYKDNGLRVIAVGGNSLSRGLTLEGLCVSYFDRNSQMYDTLMQMGRWFGFRDGYEKLFRIWMNQDAISWYGYITNASADLRDQIGEMRRVGLTPKDFGLKIQQDKTSLFVTAKNKMRSTMVVERWITLSAELIETPRLIARRDNLISNAKLTNDFIKRINSQVHADLTTDNRAIFKEVPKSIVADYIRNFISHPRHIPFAPIDLSRGIEQSSSFEKWDVAIIGGSGELIKESIYFNQEIADLGIKSSKRIMTTIDNCLLISGQRARVGVPGATKCGLSESEIRRIEVEFLAGRKVKTTIPDKPYLNVNRNPILLIYIIEVDVEDQKPKRKANSDQASIKLASGVPVIALGLGFPGNGDSMKIKYVLNKVEMQNYLNYEDEEDDEYNED